MNQKHPLILGIIGQRRSGKGTAAAYIVEKYSAKHLRFSQILEETLNRVYLPPTRENLINMGIMLRKTYGGDVLGRALKIDIEKCGRDFVVIEGFRFPEDFTNIQNLPNFHLLYISVDEKIQFDRLKHSEKPDEKNMTWEMFQEISKRDTEKHIHELSKQADIKIENNGTLEEFYTKIDEIVKKIQSLPRV